jgi:glycosyltransferase involved in cell wall biosynthesis
MQSLRFAAAIPAFEAGPSIAGVVRRTRGILNHVLVIDDGSTDDTGDRAREAGAVVLRLPENRGKGTALRTAFSTLFGEGFEAVVTLDADGQHLPEEIPKLVRALSPGIDLVMGTRSHLFESMGRVRRLSHALSSRAISAVAGAQLADVQTGFRVYTRRLIETTGVPESRFEAESAVVVRAVRRGLRIAWVPIELGYVDGRVTSHYRPLIDSLRIARAVARARFERR